MSINNTDNEWVPALIAELKDGTFGLYADATMLKRDIKQRPTLFNHPTRAQSVKSKWNNGQMLIDTGDYKLSVVDTTRIDNGICGTMLAH